MTRRRRRCRVSRRWGPPYLRSFAEQTKLTVLAHWPKDSADSQKRLPQSIAKEPAAEALDILCRTYHGEWTRDDEDGKIIRLRAVRDRGSKPAQVAPVPVAGTTAPAAPVSAGG